jgi:phage tail-like protein
MKFFRVIGLGAFALAAFFCSLQDGFSQVSPFQATLQMNSPSYYLADWSSRTSTADFKVINNTGQPKMAKLLTRICKNGVLQAFTKQDKVSQVIVQPGANDYFAETLLPYSSVKFTNDVDQSSQRAGRIPDGFYTICVTLIDASGAVPTPSDCIPSPSPVVAPVLAEDCQTFMIFSYNPPNLILPGNGDSLCALGANNVIDKRDGRPVINFQWSPIVPVPQTPVLYHFAIYEVLPGQSDVAAFRGARAVFETGKGFLPDLFNQTSFLWPTQYFLPEKGKTYVWSVRALDEKGNPFILTNDGWAEPFTFSIPLNCNQGGSSGLEGLIIYPSLIDFGSINLTKTSENQQVTIINRGENIISLKEPVISSADVQKGFVVDREPPMLTLAPGTSTSFTLNFSPSKIGQVNGVVKIPTDGGTAQIPLQGQGIDAKGATIQIVSPRGGEIIPSGSQFKIQFSASDNNAFSIFQIDYSTDGGASFPNFITNVDSARVRLQYGPATGMWNIPVNLETNQARIRVKAFDKTGNEVYAVSRLFSIGSGPNDGGQGGLGSNNDPNQNKSLSEIFDYRTSYRFIPLGARLVTNTPLPSSSLNDMIPQISVHAPQTGDSLWSYINKNGNINHLAIQIPSEMRFSAIHPPFDQILAAFTGGNPDDANNDKGHRPQVKIQGLDGGESITAYFNPKEISVDKSVPWQKHRNAEGDAPTLEFTASEPKSLSCELMFDTYEDRKSVTPIVNDLEKIASGGAVNLITFGKMHPVKVKVDSLHPRYTMFLPDGTPCRATVHIRFHRLDSLPPHHAKESSAHDKQNKEDGSYMALWGASPSDLPSNAQPIMNDPAAEESEGILIGLLRSQKNDKMGNVHSNPLYEDRLKLSQGYIFKFESEEGTAFFKSASGLKTESEVSDYEEGGVTGFTRKIIGVTKWANIVLKQGISDADASGKIKTFLAGIALKTTTNRKGISITQYDRDGNPIIQYILYHGYPVKWEGPDLNGSGNEVAIENLELGFDAVEIVSPRDIAPTEISGNLNTANAAFSIEEKRMTFAMPTELKGTPATLLVTGLIEFPFDANAAAATQRGFASNTIHHNAVALSATLPYWDWNTSVHTLSRTTGMDGSVRGDRSYVGGRFALEIDHTSAGFMQSLEGEQAGDEQSKPISLQVYPIGMPIYDWINASLGKHKRKDGAIVAADFYYKAKSIREFKDALITEVTIPALDGVSKDPGYIKITFKPETIKDSKPENGNTAGKYALDAKIQKSWTPANFRLKIEGLEEACKKINKIEATSIKQKNTEDAVGQLRDYEKEPASVEIPNLVITFSDPTPAKPFYQWYEDVRAGKSSSKKATLEYLNSEGETLMVFGTPVVMDKIFPQPPYNGGGPVRVMLKTSDDHR